jgi:TRAP-type uncharacterized transport system fused permease subunit
MKKGGYRPEVAAAIEAVGSTGSMIMPPVMGAAAFIIPEMIGGTYLDVVKAAIIPALLFYTTLYMVVELQAVKLGLRGFPKAELPNLRSLFRGKGHMLIPIGVLIYFLAIKMSTPPRAAFWGAVACVLASQLRRGTRMGLREIVSALEKARKELSSWPSVVLLPVLLQGRSVWLDWVSVFQTFSSPWQVEVPFSFLF